MATTNYCKYAYWVDQRKVGALKAALKGADRSVIESTKAVCVPLSRRIEIGIVSPATWKNVDLCKRPLSWYWVSKRAGQFLIISSSELTEFGLSLQIVLRPITFRPPRLPNEEEKADLISRPSYTQATPRDWNHFDAQELARQETWMRNIGIRGKRFETLFLTHCANHANFIEPEYFVQHNNSKVPYSIGKTKEICSACLEFFNVLGEAHPVKYVVPCPGAVIYAGLPVNRYIEVETNLS
jgi:hypothetical protein